MIDKAPDAFRTISEAADDLDLPQHVLRFWETRFTQIKPLKRGGGRRYYRPDDLEFLRGLKHLLHAERYTIKGVQKIIKDQGIKAVQSAWKNSDPADMIGKSGATSQPPRTLEQSMLSPVEPFSGVQARRAGGNVNLNAPVRQKLEAALAELMDCRRVLATLHAS
jgi:DNA-binding transcriptional MerR regulator